jgi:Ulp1 family protease
MLSICHCLCTCPVYNLQQIRTKKFDVFALDKVIIPANVGNMHWCLAVVYVQEGRIQYYDRYTMCIHTSVHTSIYVLRYSFYTLQTFQCHVHHSHVYLHVLEHPACQSNVLLLTLCSLASHIIHYILHYIHCYTLLYYSMGGRGSSYTEALEQWLDDEHAARKGCECAIEWELVPTLPTVPQQSNGSDCGVFSCMFADYISEDLSLQFSQADMPHFRQRLALQILRKQAL